MDGLPSDGAAAPGPPPAPRTGEPDDGGPAAELVVPLGADEVLGLRAVALLEGGADGGRRPDDVATELVRAALRAKLADLGLPWAPGTERVAAARRTTGSPRARWVVAARAAAVAAAAVVVSGGYLGDWRWTGFRGNEQVWDWLQLLLLPLAFATLPLWLRYADRISRGRRVAYGVAVAAFAAFVAVGYAVPLGWTGFGGRTLWDWLTLLLLPATLVTVQTWSSTTRTVRLHHRVALAALGAAGVLTVIGGYAWTWRWTGYEGNTLWDWLQLLLLPLVFPTVLAPALVRFITGDVETTPVAIPVATPAATPAPTPAATPGTARARASTGPAAEGG